MKLEHIKEGDIVDFNQRKKQKEDEQRKAQQPTGGEIDLQSKYGVEDAELNEAQQAFDSQFVPLVDQLQKYVQQSFAFKSIKELHQHITNTLNTGTTPWNSKQSPEEHRANIAKNKQVRQQNQANIIHDDKLKTFRNNPKLSQLLTQMITVWEQLDEKYDDLIHAIIVPHAHEDISLAAANMRTLLQVSKS